MSYEMYRQQFEGESFNDLLVDQMKRAPWFLISLALHVVLFLVVKLLSGLAPEPPKKVEVQMALDQTLDEEVLQEEPEIEEEPEPEEPEQVEDPVTDEQEVADHDESESNEEYEESLGNEDSISDQPFSSTNNNDAIGLGGGAGGSFGGRRGGRKKARRGRGAAAQKAVDYGLEWLARHQSKDGSWDSDGFNCDPEKGECKGAGQCQAKSKGRALHDVGVSGLSLLAFLGAGETPSVGNYKTNVNNGLRWLKDQQDAEGCFGPRTDKRYTYSHAIATLAMTEAYLLSNKSPRFKEPAQKGINYIIQCQNPYKAWRYGERPGDNDTSVTGWMVMALKSAKGGGLDVPEESMTWALSWVEEMTDEETGRTGYIKRGEPPVREEDKLEAFPASESESLTAVGMLCRVFCGQNPTENGMLKLGASLLEKKLPVWDQAKGSIDQYYWYYGTLSMYQVGGKSWEAWNNAMNSAIVSSQRQDGGFRGSWDPVGAWGEEGGRVYSTALMTLCLEVYYRYGRVFGIK